MSPTEPLTNIRKRTSQRFACAILGAVLILGFTSPAAAAPGDEHWDAQFGLPGVTNVVYSLLVDGGRVYAGGFNIGSPSTNTVDCWDGTRWSSLPGEIAGSGLSVVYALARQGPNLYVGGIFSRAGGVTARSLARWDGAGWSEVGGGVFGAVFALAVSGSDLYVAGSFTNVGGVLVTNIARWDGTQWHSLGGGLAPYDAGAATAVRRLRLDGGILYAAGAFTNAGGVAVQNIAQWNGSSWSALGAGVSGAVQAMTGSGSDLYVGGDITSAGGVPVANVARWNGSTWSALGAGVNSTVYALGLLDGRVYAGGAFTSAGGVPALRVARWDGAAWSALGNGMNDAVSEIVVDGFTLLFGGLFNQADDLVVNHVARFDGTNWSALGNRGRDQGSPTFTRLVQAAGGKVYLGGLFSGVGSARANRLAGWDGTNWFPLGSGVKGTNEGSGTTVNAVAVSGNDVYAGGMFTNAGGVAANNIAKWNGSTWSALGSGVNGSVAALAVLGSNVYAGGTFTTAGGVTAFNIAKWDGAGWSALPPPFVGLINNFFVNALAVSGNDLYVGGAFFAGGNATNIARFSGGQWFPLGLGVNSNVNAIAIVGLDVYVGGRFTSAGGVSASRVARWNGNTWSALGSGVSGTGTIAVNALATVGTNLYAGGGFTVAGGLNVNRIAKWDGLGWSALGQGLSRQSGSPTVNSLSASGDNLYVAGTFIGAGGKASSYVARWNEQRNFDLQPMLQLSAPQRSGNGRFQFRITATGVPAYVIEATTNWNAWTPLLTNSASPFDFTDPGAAGHDRRYYRSRGL